MEHTRQEGPSLVLAERGDIVNVLRRSPDFRRLLFAQMISMGGDWFTTVPVMAMALELTKSPLATSFVLICSTLPSFLVTPLSGVLADRFNRKKIIVCCNFLSAIVVLGLLLVDRPERVWLCYACMSLLVIMGAFILPAATAAIPCFVRRDSLGGANALFGTTWGLMLAIGSAAGGYVASRFGRAVAFEIDSVALLVAGILVLTIRQHDFRAPEAPRVKNPDIEECEETEDDVSFMAALLHLRQNPHLALVVLSKAFWGLGAGIILLMAVFPVEVYNAANPDRAVGLMYSMRGVGTLLGPVLALVLVRNQTAAMAQAISISLVVSGVFYVAFSQAPSMDMGAFCILLASLGTGAVWVLSTTMMQLSVPDKMMGRLSAIDLGTVTLTMAISQFLSGWGMDRAVASGLLRGAVDRQTGLIIGTVAVISGLIWGLLWQLSRRKRPPLVPQRTLAEAKATARLANMPQE